MTSRRSVLSFGLAAAALGGGFWVDRRASAMEQAAEAAFPPTGSLIRVDGFTVHAHQEGTGPDLVLIHGASANTRDYTFDMVGKLADRYRVTVFDRPGLGWSEDIGEAALSPQGQAAHLIKAARQLGLQNPLLMAQSYGASVALAWALQDSAAGLVLVSGAMMPWEGRALGAFYEVAQTGLGGVTAVPLIAAFPPYGYARQAVESVAAPESAPQGYADYIGLPLILRRNSIRVNARQVGRLKSHIFEMLPDYPRLTLPVEILHGTADQVTFASVHSEPLHRLLPQSRLTLLEGAGHMAHHTRQAEVIAAIDRLVK
ncbi:alpha/beta fold hydrolase [Neogemmobacter tilapiae]|nr:alpha/beta hydrolase [Gemmobacter tilapiae]